MSRAVIAKLERDLAAATKKSDAACTARSRLPAGSSRARVTTANARWMRAAEARDRLSAQLIAALEEQIKAEAA